MTPEQVVAFLLFAVVAAVTPGPSNLLLTATGAHVGVVRGLPCLLGVGIGMGVMMFVVAFGLGSVVLANPTVLRALNWIGAAAFQWINPKSWLVCTSAAGAYLTAGAGSALARAMAFGALFILCALPSGFVWLAFGATAQRFLRSERARRTFNISMGVLLAGSVVLVVR